MHLAVYLPIMCKCIYIMQAPSRSSWKAYSTESSPGGLKGRSNGLNRTRKSLSPVPRFSSSSIRSSDIRRLSTPPPSTRLLPGSPDVHSNNGEIFFKKYSEYFIKKKESQYTYIHGSLLKYWSDLVQVWEKMFQIRVPEVQVASSLINLSLI